MSRTLTTLELETLRLHLSTVRKVPGDAPLYYRDRFCGNGHDMLAALEELSRWRGEAKPRKGNPGARSVLSKLLLSLAPGDIRPIPRVSYGGLATARATLKRLHPERVFHSTRIGGTMHVWRAEDNSPRFLRQHSELSRRLAQMRLGEHIDYSNTSGRFPHDAKVMARALMQEPEAQWSYTTISPGKFRVRRTK